jgi:hypothetical protein
MLFMNERLMDLPHLFPMNDRLMNLMDHILMLLVNNVLMMLMDHILMMLMNNILVMLLNDGCRFVLLNESWGCMGLHLCLDCVLLEDRLLLVSNDYGCRFEGLLDNWDSSFNKMSAILALVKVLIAALAED